METVDDEFLEAAEDFIRRQQSSQAPFFVWFNTSHMHFRTHVKPQSRGQAGRWQSDYHDTMIDHDKVVGALLDHLAQQSGTTNVSAIDADGNVCVLTTSLGLGSGDFLPGLDLHLNSMLGEADLFTEGLGPGDRMASMMAPTLALGSAGVVLAAGAAGGTRLRSALLQVVAGILDEGLEPQAAVDRPRVHPAGALVHLEPGYGPETIAVLESAGFEVRRWDSQHHYFGGVSVVTPDRAAADPRRSGAARIV
jgi:gamma-glutamyltranspeptidase/glutathione hydrolase